MIIYNATKSAFLDDILSNDIENIVLEQFTLKTGRRVPKQEIPSWKNSLQSVNKVLAGDEIPSPVDSNHSAARNLTEPPTSPRDAFGEVDCQIRRMNHPGSSCPRQVSLRT